MTSKVEKKAQVLEKKSNFVVETFHLPSTEDVVQDYHCGLWKTIAAVQGRLYITENYICFHATFPPIALSFELENIKSMKKYRAMLVAPTGIEIALVDGTVYQFQSFVHREEAFSVINYLWKHVPVYIDVPDSELYAAVVQREETTPKEKAGSKHSSGGDWRAKSHEQDAAAVVTPAANASTTVQQLQHYEVDTERSKNVLRILADTEQIGAQTAHKLAMQGEQLREADRGLDRIEGHLKHGDRILSGMTLTGALKNKLTNQGMQSGAAAQPTTTTTTTTKTTNKGGHFDIEVLLKLPSDALLPALFRLESNWFSFHDPANRQQHLKHTGYAHEKWLYQDIDKVVVRARPLHLDIVMKSDKSTPNSTPNSSAAKLDQTPTEQTIDSTEDDGFHIMSLFNNSDKSIKRVRILASYLQVIVNELCWRTREIVGVCCDVQFEPGVREFAFDSLLISSGSDSWKPVARGLEAEIVMPPGVAFRRTSTAAADAKKTALQFDSVDKETNDKLLEQETHLYQMSEGIGRLKSLGGAMGSELDRQNALLNDMNQKTDDVQAHMKRTTKKVKSLT